MIYSLPLTQRFVHAPQLQPLSLWSQKIEQLKKHLKYVVHGIVSRPIERDQLLRNILKWAIIADVVLLPILFIRIAYFPRPMAVAFALGHSNNTLPMTAGPATKQFMQQLTASNLILAPALAREVSRPTLSVNGRIITLGGDNVQVFEYPNHDIAMNEGSALANKYTASKRFAAWKKDTHVYVNRGLVILYVGHQSAIVNSLEQNAGLALMTNATTSLSVK